MIRDVPINVSLLAARRNLSLAHLNARNFEAGRVGSQRLQLGRIGCRAVVAAHQHNHNDQQHDRHGGNRHRRYRKAARLIRFTEEDRFDSSQPYTLAILYRARDWVAAGSGSRGLCSCFSGCHPEVDMLLVTSGSSSRPKHRSFIAMRSGETPVLPCRGFQPCHPRKGGQRNGFSRLKLSLPNWSLQILRKARPLHRLSEILTAHLHHHAHLLQPRPHALGDAVSQKRPNILRAHCIVGASPSADGPTVR